MPLHNISKYSPFPFRVVIPKKGGRQEKIKWCNENIVVKRSGELVFVPPYVPKETVWFSDPKDEQWLFKREEDAVLFEMTWGEWSGS